MACSGKTAHKQQVTGYKHIGRMLIFAYLLGACTTEPSNPATINVCDGLDPRTFYVINHGLHTGIAVNRKDLADITPFLTTDLGSEEYIEFGWGDERFYQARTVTFGLAIQAMLWPTSAVLHVAGIPETPQSYFSNSEILEISVPQSGYNKLLVYIVETFERTIDGNLVRLGPGLYGNSYFYRANGSFHTFNTCNTWVAKSIEASGFPITSRGIIRAENLLSLLRRGIDTDMNCFSIR